MRIMRLLILLFLSTLSTITGITVTQSIFSSGTPTLNGCSNNVANYTFTLGTCVPDGKGNSLMVNDCWKNGLGSLSFYQGTTCLPTNASSLAIFGTNNNYCNVGTDQNSTFTCDNYTQPIPTQVVRVTSYPIANGGCNGTAFPQTNDFPIGVCTPAFGGTTYIIANCMNGVPSAVLYGTSNCSITFNDTTGAINSYVGAAGLWVQKGINSTIASNCNKTPASYDEFQCITLPSSSSSSSSSSLSSSSTSSRSTNSTSSTTSSSSSSSSSGTGSSSPITTSTSSITTNSTTSTTGNTTGSSSSSSTGTIIISSSSTGQNNTGQNNGAIIVSISFVTIMIPFMTLLQWL